MGKQIEVGSHAYTLARALQAKRHEPEAVIGVYALSAEAAAAAEEIHKLLPEQMDMEQFVGIVGNLCLCLGITGENMTTFKRALPEFVEIMDRKLKDQRNG